MSTSGGGRVLLPVLSSLVARVRSAPARLGGVRLVCVDGPAGAGKTTLAAALAEQIAGAVVHLDDLYEGWTGLGGVWDRVESQVLRPLAEGRPAAYQRYDWPSAHFAEWVPVPPTQVLVLEGCGSAPRAVDRWASLIVFVDAPADLRLRRGVSRDGEALRGEWLRWMQLEAVEHAEQGTRQRADVVVDGRSGREVRRGPQP